MIAAIVEELCAALEVEPAAVCRISNMPGRVVVGFVNSGMPGVIGDTRVYPWTPS